MKRCLIIGGGIAGLTAASILSSKNISVTVLESSPKLGGRTYSFLDKTTDTIIDNGQHIMMGCYKDTLSFIKLIGAEGNLEYQKNLSLKFLDRGKKEFQINADSYFYPINLLFAILNYNVLKTSEKISFLLFIAKLPLVSKRSIKNLTVKDWLEKENQDFNVIKNFWEILCTGALNTNLEKASALVFYDVLIQIFFKGNFASTIILPKYGLSESLINPAEKFIKKNNGQVILSETVKEMVIENSRVIVVKSENNIYNDFDYVISAIPLFALKKIILKNKKNIKQNLEPALSAGRLELNLELKQEYSTILNIHIWLNDSKLSEKFYGFLDSSLHWIFVKENRLNVVISDADYLIDKSNDELYDFVMDELVQYISINKSEVQHYKFIKENLRFFLDFIFRERL
ncbi:MAG: oleate hydratase [Ignavibacteria bacterium]|nr:oleate hydratase [Ignavibacteria bacterium]